MSILQLALALLDDSNQVSHGTVSSRVPWDTSTKPPPGQCGQLGRLGHSGREGGDEWDATDWRAYFDERAGILEFDGGWPRPEGEARAWECCIAEWLIRHPARSDPGRCHVCGESSAHETLLPYGTAETGHTWLHGCCWPAWYSGRQKHAAAALRDMGVGPAGEGAVHG